MKVSFTRDGEWEKYAKHVRQFDAILEHSMAVSLSMAGKPVYEDHLSYAEIIFVKMLGHCVILRKLLPDPNQLVRNEFWDPPSLYAIARSAIETFDALDYIALQEVNAEERSFRVLLWKYHDQTRRMKMLSAMKSTNPQVASISKEVERLLESLKTHVAYPSLDENNKRKILEGDPAPFHLSKRERCKASDISFDFYNGVTMQLSQFVHSHPFSLHQMIGFRAGSKESLNIMALAQQFVLPFLARAVEGVRSLFPSCSPEPPSRTKRNMEIWAGLASQDCPWAP